MYAYAGIDLLYALLWFAAFVAVAVWRGQGLEKGAKDGKDASCENFGYGSSTRCETAAASVGFGVIVFLLFVITSAISIHGVLKYRKTGVMPQPQLKKVNPQPMEDDFNKDAWSSNMQEPDERPSTSQGEIDPRRAYGQIPTEDDEQNLLHRPSLQAEDPFQDTHSMTEHGMHPGRPMSFQSTSTGLSIAPPSYHERPADVTDSGVSPSGYVAPSALSPSDYQETPGGRINFPTGNYGADFR
jgi:hypothetical protein